MKNLWANPSVLRFDQTFCLVPVCMAVLDPNGAFSDVNPAFCALFGHTSGELTGKAVGVIFPRDDWQCLLAATPDGPTVATGEAEWMARRSDGSPLTVRQATVPITTDDGVNCHLMTVTDVTKYAEVEESLHIHQVELEMQNDELRKTQLAIDNARIKYIALYEEAPIGYCTISRKGLIWQANLAAASILGMQKPDLLNLSLSRFVHRDDAPKFFSLLKRLLATQEPQSCDVRLAGQADREKWIHLSASKVMGLDDIEEVRVILADITSRVEMSRAMAESEERWKFALEGSGDGVWDWNIQSGQATFSRRWKEMLGHTDDEIQGNSEEWVKRVHPEDMPTVKKALDEHIDRVTASATVDFRMQAKDGTYRWIQGRGMVVSRDAYGRALRLVGTNTDITERKLADVELRRALDENRALISAIPDLILANHRDGTYLAVETAESAHLFAPPNDLIGQTVRHVLPSSLADRFLDAIGKALDTRTVQELKYSLDVEGKDRWFEARVASSTQDTAISIVRDITNQEEMEDRLEQLAFYDPLTKLANRRLWLDRLGQAISATNRTGQYGAVIFLDLDNFKPLNDKYGHEIGDLLLIEVALRLKRGTRDMDAVGRFGGDEFVLMLADLSNDKERAKSQAELVAEKVRLSLSEPFFLPVNPAAQTDAMFQHCCGASVGIALFGNGEASQQEVLRQADSAMYSAKASGRNAFRFFQ